MAVKTYALLDSLNPTAPVFQRVGKERQRINKMPYWKPYLQTTFTDKDGVNRTIRYKQTATSIYLDEQIEKNKIPANEKYTTRERRAPEFRNGILVTNDILLQDYLNEYPANEKFEGTSDESKSYREVNKELDAKVSNESFKKRAKAAFKIAEINLDRAQEKIYVLYGSFYPAPDNLIDAQNILIDFLDNAEEEGVDAILADDITSEEEVTVFVGKALSEKVLSFDAIEGKVAILKNKKWIAIKDVSKELPLEEKKRLLSEYFISDTGLEVYGDALKTLSVAIAESKKAMELKET